MATVDVWGRRPLLLWGSAGCALSMCACTTAYVLGSAFGLLACISSFCLSFSITWAGVYW